MLRRARFERHYYNPRRQGKSLMTGHAVDFAAATGHNLMLGTSKPKVWADYLKEHHPKTLFKIVEGGIVINPKER